MIGSAAKKEYFTADSRENPSARPAVMVAPDDVELITGASEERRRYMDTVLSQVDTGYLQHLIQYNKVLQQRNSLLKRFAEQGRTDWPLLEVINDQLVPPRSELPL